MSTPTRFVLAMTGATGQIFGVTALDELAGSSVETHLVVSPPSMITLEQEGLASLDELRDRADFAYTTDETDAPIADPSFDHAGVLVSPCSMKTLAGVAHARRANLISTVADASLEAGRPVVLMPREKPLNLIHLRNMRRVHERGGTLSLPMLEARGTGEAEPLEAVVRGTVGRVLASFPELQELELGADR